MKWVILICGILFLLVCWGLSRGRPTTIADVTIQTPTGIVRYEGVSYRIDRGGFRRGGNSIIDVAGETYHGTWRIGNRRTIRVGGWKWPTKTKKGSGRR
jgi:hypothetical protein